jgi:tRNA U55 pseudouridine synthase TruB
MRSAPGPERSVFPAPSAIPAAARVTTYAIEIVRCEDAMITLRVHCTAGFYVRALAHDLGERLEVGAHLAALRRTRSGDITLDDAVALEELEDAGFGHARAIRAMIPLARMLPAIPACLLTLDGARRAIHGRDLGPADFVEGSAGAEFSGRASTTASGHFRLIDPDGTLVGVAEASAATGLLHPAVILV